MALPPMRPRTMRNGTPRGFGGERLLRFRGADEADRNAENGRRLRRAGIDQFEQAEQRGRRIADGDHRAGEAVAPQIERRRRAGRAVFRRERRGARIVERADDLVARRQPRARDAVRHHFGIAQDRRAGGERAARRRDEVAAEDDVLRHIDLAAGMDHAHRDLGFLGREARQVGLGADDGERALVDRRAVAQIGGALRHGRLAFSFAREPRNRRRQFVRSPRGRTERRAPCRRRPARSRPACRRRSARRARHGRSLWRSRRCGS